MKLHRLAGEIMTYLDAYEGSRPALDAAQILIVRGHSKKRIKADNMKNILDNLMEHLQAKEIDLLSDAGTDLISIMDENIRKNVEVGADPDIAGVQRLKESLENMNFTVEYRLGIAEKTGFFIVLYKDKSDMGPCFVEIVVSDLGE
ncbi:MAG: DUF2120 domain-containing protein [Methanobacteriales archaeon]|nr:DUF2120 domain-containing protein [Methanobacteriales archaeon]MBC7118027.1 DUF2120 domain-containing protein [Methanobacteriaceae archaeon]NPV65208.1 DUF2120 domain-containing protein [Methanobacteriaceae archaeon]